MKLKKLRPTLLQEIVFYRLNQRLLIIFISLLASIFGLMAPLLQKEFIDGLLHNQHQAYLSLKTLSLGTEITPLQIIPICFFVLITSQALTQLTNYLGLRESLIMQRRLSDLIYKKHLALNVDAKNTYQNGEIVSLYATDISSATVLLDQTLPYGTTTFFPLVLAPLVIKTMFNIPVGVLSAFMLGFITLNTALAFRQSRFFFSFKRLAADRIALVNEWIQSIKTIRILGWIDKFENNIFQKRQFETANRVAMVTNGQTMNTISTSVTFALSILGLISLIFYSDRSPTSGELLALFWIVGLFLTRPFRQLPWFFTFAFDALTSIQRLEKFLNLPNTHFSISSPGFHNLSFDELNKDCVLEIHNLNLKIHNRSILGPIHLKLNPGEFVALVGEVGSGKSMLLLSLLGETGAQCDFYKINGISLQEKNIKDLKDQFCYMPQEAFVMSATLRNNINFDYNHFSENEFRILSSLEKAQLDLEKDKFYLGLDTLIGERGVNLSGGQKQRVNLARAHFKSGQIILLDDFVSAVDIETEKKLIMELREGPWKNQTRLIATHRLSVLDKVDRIIYLVNGQIEDEGTYDQLKIRNQKFREFAFSNQPVNLY